MNPSQTISINTGAGVKTVSQVVSFVDILFNIYTASKNGIIASYEYLKEVLWYRPREIPNKNTLRELEENKSNVDDGFVSPTFDSVDKMLDWLHSPSKKYQNGIRVVG